MVLYVPSKIPSSNGMRTKSHLNKCPNYTVSTSAAYFYSFLWNKSNSVFVCLQGLRKRDLLREVLPVVGENLRFQRLFTEYQDQLELLRNK